MHVFVAFLAALLVLCYTGLVFNEIYSKRSTLGSVVPFFVIAWYLVALVPATIHSIFARLRKARLQRMVQAHLQNFDTNVLGNEPDDRRIPTLSTSPLGPIGVDHSQGKRARVEDRLGHPRCR